MNKKIIIGLICGSLVSSILSLLLVDEVSFSLSEYFLILVGAFLGGILVKNKPILIGVFISIIQSLISYLGLILVMSATSGELTITHISMRIWLQWIFYLPFGLLGAYTGIFLGEKISKRR